MAMAITDALLYDLGFGLISVILFFIMALQQLRLYRKYPFQGLRFYFIGIFLGTFAINSVVVILIARIYGLAEDFHEFLLLFYMFGYSIAIIGIGIFAIGLLIIQPTKEEKNWSFTQVLIGALAGLCSGAIFTSLQYEFYPEGEPLYGDITIEYDPIVIIGLLALVILMAGIALVHIRQLRRIQKLQTKPTIFQTSWLPVAYITLVLAFITLSVQRLPLFRSSLPELLFAVPLAVSGFAFSMSFYKYPSILSITSSRLSSLIFINPEGLTLYAYDFKNKEALFDNLTVLLGGMLAALNISLSETLESREGLSSIAFGDKIIVIRSTPKFVLYLITSEMNPTISDLVNLYVKRFDEHFGDIIGTSHLIEQEVFLTFNNVVEDLIQFAPLSV
jgi:hypothetical protein